MVVTIFRSRLKPENVEEYYQWAARIAALAKTLPGYVSHKGRISTPNTSCRSAR